MGLVQVSQLQWKLPFNLLDALGFLFELGYRRENLLQTFKNGTEMTWVIGKWNHLEFTWKFLDWCLDFGNSDFESFVKMC